MIEVLNNPWVSGIGGGLISGIIVYLFTNWLMGRKENSEHIKKVKNANSDVISTLKPYISENGLPDPQIVSAIILSTARKYLISPTEMYTIKIFCEELIREIIDNVYVSGDKKREYAEALKEYIFSISKNEKGDEYENIRLESAMRAEYTSKYKKLFSLNTALLSSVSMILAFIAAFKDTDIMNSPVWVDPPILVLLILSMSIGIISVLFYFYGVYKSKIRK